MRMEYYRLLFFGHGVDCMFVQSAYCLFSMYNCIYWRVAA